MFDLSKADPGIPENVSARRGWTVIVRVILIILLILLFAGCRTTEVVHVLEQPTARHTGQTDTVYVRHLPDLIPGDPSAPIRITHSTQVDTLLPGVELVGITMTRDAVAVRTRTDGIVSEHTYRSVRAAGETQLILPDSSGQLQASVTGTPRADTVLITVTPPRERPKFWSQWWFGPVGILLALAIAAYFLRKR